MRTRRTKEQIRKDIYNKDVDAYNFYVVNLDTMKAETGFEFKEDAVDVLNDYDDKKKYKVVSKKALKSLGVENPNESFKYAGGGEFMTDPTFGNFQNNVYADGGVTNNYVSRRNLNTITIKKGNQKLTYKISDVLNGAYKLESGAKLEDIAFYVPKRSIVKVQLKTGKDFKPANGYWIKDGAKPIHITKFDDGGFLYVDNFELDKDKIKNAKYLIQYNRGLYTIIDNKTKKAISVFPTQISAVNHIKTKLSKFDEGGVMSRLLTRKKDQPKVETTNEDIDLNEDSRIRVRPSSFVRKDKEGDWMMKKNSSKEARSYAGGGKVDSTEEDKLMRENDIVLLQGNPTISGQILARKNALKEIELSEKSGESDVYPSMLQNWKKSHKETIKKLEKLKEENSYAGGGKTETPTKKGRGNHKMKATTDLAKKIRKDGEKWTDALRRASQQMK